MIERKFNKSISHDKLRLHSSERNSSWGKLFDEFKNEISDSDIKFYPNTDELNVLLSHFYGTKDFIIGFGSDRCIKYFFEANSEAKELIISNPSFSMYEIYGKLFKMSINKVPYKQLTFPIDDIIKEVKKESIIVLSNPSSPVGDIISNDDIKKILDIGVPTLVDEAYIEFSDKESVIPMIEKYSNLYVVRTFSKALGSAGIRFGLIFSNKNNIKKTYQFRDMYETTSLAVKWIKIVLNNLNYVYEYIDNVKQNRVILAKDFIELGYDVVTSNCNWLHIKGLKILPENVIFKTNCTLPELGDGWIRLQITDNLNDYTCLLKSKEIAIIN
jgi:histidinol-phosphate aminotransferase